MRDRRRRRRWLAGGIISALAGQTGGRHLTLGCRLAGSLSLLRPLPLSVCRSARTQTLERPSRGRCLHTRGLALIWPVRPSVRLFVRPSVSARPARARRASAPPADAAGGAIERPKPQPASALLNWLANSRPAGWLRSRTVGRARCYGC